MRLELLADLNPEQREAALCETHCLTVAAPGSGKTKMLSAKAAFLLSRGATVVAVTFTRDAAIELRDRIVRQSGEGALPRLLVGTFHSIDLLMAFPSRARSAMGSAILAKARSTLQRPWSIIRAGSRRGIIARSVDAAGLVLEVDEAAAIIERIKSGAGGALNERESALAATYADLLGRHGAIDFQDILLKTNKGLAAGSIAPLSAGHLLLDEFQDTDLPQFQWAMAHARSGSVITAVGDDDQCIYGFRRALGYEGMAMFEQQTRATRVVLGTNYRSNVEVLACAGRAILMNDNRMAKALVSHRGEGGAAKWERFATRTVEAEACAHKAASVERQGMTFGVLARTNARLENIEAALRAKGIEYWRSARDSLLNTRELAVLVATFNLILADSARDADELLSWCGVDEDDLREVQQCLGDQVLASLSRKATFEAALKDSTRKAIRAVVTALVVWRSAFATGGLEFLVSSVTDFLASARSDDKRSARILQVCGQMFFGGDLPAAAMTQVAREPDRQAHWRARGRSFQQRVSTIRAAMGGTGRKDDAMSNARVHLLTVHASKGLEFDEVWVLGAEEGTFPDEEKASIQEERRLMYVAMTRARRNLWISAAGSREISRFVIEAGMDRVPQGTFSAQEAGVAPTRR